MENTVKILLIEDDRFFAQVVQHMIAGQHGLVLDWEENLTLGLQYVKQNPVDIILLDLNLPESNGLETLKVVRNACQQPIIILTGLDSEEIAYQAIKAGAQDYLLKNNVWKDILIRSIRHALERKRARDELHQAHRSLEQKVQEQTYILRKTNIKLNEELRERKALEKVWQRYDFIVNTSAELMTLVDRSYRYEAVNNAYCQAHGKDRDDIIGKTVAELWGAERFFTEIRPNFDNCFLGEEVQYLGWFYFSHLGQRYMEVTYYPYANDKNRITHAVIVSKDRTSQKRADDRLREYANRLQNLNKIDKAILSAKSPAEIAHSALLPIHEMLDTRIAEVYVLNVRKTDLDVIARLEGEQSAEITKSVPIDQIGPFRNQKKLQIINLKREQTLPPFLAQIYDQGLSSAIISPLIAEQQLIGLLVLGFKQFHEPNPNHLDIVQEVSAQLAVAIHQAKLFDEVNTQRKRLRVLTNQLIDAQEEERRRLARELHDEAGQALTALNIHLKLIQQMVPAENDQVIESLDDGIRQVRSTMDQLRMLAHNLRPPALDTLGLNKTLESYCQKIARQTNLGIIYLGAELPTIPGELSICFYRCAQEAITNIIKHANATSAIVKLSRINRMIKLEVEDNGDGFSTEEGLNAQHGIGLLGMQERLENLGGGLQVYSDGGSGTRLVATIQWDVTQ